MSEFSQVVDGPIHLDLTGDFSSHIAKVVIDTVPVQDSNRVVISHPDDVLNDLSYTYYPDHHPHVQSRRDFLVAPGQPSASGRNVSSDDVLRVRVPEGSNVEIRPTSGPETPSRSVSVEVHGKLAAATITVTGSADIVVDAEVERHIHTQADNGTTTTIANVPKGCRLTAQSAKGRMRINGFRGSGTVEFLGRMTAQNVDPEEGKWLIIRPGPLTDEGTQYSVFPVNLAAASRCVVLDPGGNRLPLKGVPATLPEAIPPRTPNPSGAPPGAQSPPPKPPSPSPKP